MVIYQSAAQRYRELGWSEIIWLSSSGTVFTQRLSALIGPGLITVIKTSSHWSGSCNNKKQNITSSPVFNYFPFIWDICLKVYINISLWLIIMIWFRFCWWVGLQLTDSSLPEVRSGWGCHTPWIGGCCPQWTPGRPPLGHWPDQYRSRWDCGPVGGALEPLSPPKKIRWICFE